MLPSIPRSSSPRTQLPIHITKAVAPWTSLLGLELNCSPAFQVTPPGCPTCVPDIEPPRLTPLLSPQTCFSLDPPQTDESPAHSAVQILLAKQYITQWLRPQVLELGSLGSGPSPPPDVLRELKVTKYLCASIHFLTWKMGVLVLSVLQSYWEGEMV